MIFLKNNVSNRTKNGRFFSKLHMVKNRSYESHRSYRFYVTFMTYMTKIPYTLKKNSCLEHEKIEKFCSRLYDFSSTTLLVDTQKMSHLKGGFLIK